MYIRLVLEGHQLLLLSSVSELDRFEIGSTSEITSLVFAFMFAALCVALLAIVAYFGLVNQTRNEQSKHKSTNEFFSGLKQLRRAKAFTLCLLLRRTLFVVILLCLTGVSLYLRLLILTCLQVGYLL